MESTVEVWWREQGLRYRNERIGYYIVQGYNSTCAMESAIKDACEEYADFIVKSKQPT